MRSVLLFLLITALIDTINAQPVKLLVHIGAGTSFNSKQDNDDYYMQATKFKPALYYKTALILQVPISPRLAFETGIGYEKRTISSVQRYNFDNTHSLKHDAKINYHYVALPMQLSMCLYSSQHRQLQISAGFNYGFLIHAKKYSLTNYYYNGIIMTTPKEDSYNLSIVLFRDQNRFNTQPYRHLYMFDVATTVGISYTMTSRIAIRAHYNYSLYNIEINSDGDTNQHNTGLSFLFRLI